MDYIFLKQNGRTDKTGDVVKGLEIQSISHIIIGALNIQHCNILFHERLNLSVGLSLLSLSDASSGERGSGPNAAAGSAPNPSTWAPPVPPQANPMLLLINHAHFPPNVRGWAMKKKENNNKQKKKSSWWDTDEPTELYNLVSPTRPTPLVILIIFIVVLYLFILKDRKDVFKSLSSVLGSGRRATDCGEV